MGEKIDSNGVELKHVHNGSYSLKVGSNLLLILLEVVRLNEQVVVNYANELPFELVQLRWADSSHLRYIVVAIKHVIVVLGED